MHKRRLYFYWGGSIFQTDRRPEEGVEIMGKFYHYKSKYYDLAGSCENGYIYDVYRHIGSYVNGRIYDLYDNFIGSYENGRIYDKYINFIGSYQNGYAYDRYDNRISIYEGDGAEAAAYLLLLPGAADHAGEASTDSIFSSDDSTKSDEPGIEAQYGAEAGAGTACVAGTGSAADTDSGAGVFLALLGLLGLLFLPLSFGLIWWAVIKATGPADTPLLIIFLLSLLLGMYISFRIFKAQSWGDFYIHTVILSSIVCIIASFFTSPGYSIFIVVLLPPIVVALAAVIPTLMAYFFINLIRRGIKKRK